MALSHFSCHVLLVLALLAVAIDTTKAQKGNMKKLATANNDFALRLYKQLANTTSGNIFISPISLSSAFAMLYYGARGQTEEELYNVLGYSAAGLDGEHVPSTFRRLLRNSSLNSNDNILEIANTILVDKDLDVHLYYKREVRRMFKSHVREVDFSKDGPRIVSEVNGWVKSATHGKIGSIVHRLSPSTLMVILNAVYFKGKWKSPFENHFTRLAPFYDNGRASKKKEVLTMMNQGDFLYTKAYGAHIIELPYEGDNVSMMILLPEVLDGLPDVESQITPEGLAKIRRRLRSRNILLSLPKFKLRFAKDLSGDMEKLGAKSLFSPGADLYGMSPSQKIFVNEVQHKAVVEVNEEGTEAAAATSIAMVMSAPFPFFVDHPFLMAIVDRRSNMMLFIGRVKKLSD